MIDANKTKEKLDKMNHDELVEYALCQEITKDNYLEQLVSLRRSKFGSTSEKTVPEMVPLLNEIEKVVLCQDLRQLKYLFFLMCLF